MIAFSKTLHRQKKGKEWGGRRGARRRSLVADVSRRYERPLVSFVKELLEDLGYPVRAVNKSRNQKDGEGKIEKRSYATANERKPCLARGEALHRRGKGGGK